MQSKKWMENETQLWYLTWFEDVMDMKGIFEI